MLHSFKPHDLVLLTVPETISRRARVVEVISYPIPNDGFGSGNGPTTIMVRMVPGDPTTIREVKVFDLAPRSKARYVHVAQVRTSFPFPEDMLRYDGAALLNPDVAEDSDARSEDPVTVYRVRDKKQHDWTYARWSSFCAGIVGVLTMDLRDPEPLKNAIHL